MPSLITMRPAFAVGAAYEAGLDAAARKRGAHFTPPDLAATLVEHALRTWRGQGAPLVCDPACGGGVFLVAMADALVARGVDPGRVVDGLLVGFDIDPGAVAASIDALRLWSVEHDVVTTPRIRRADGLAPSGGVDGRVDIVIGNPPFQSQLARVNARAEADRATMVERFGAAARGYVDGAGLFVLRALQLAAHGGVVALVLPRSFLATRDGAGVRAAVTDRGTVVECWIPGVRVFDASVDVCMPIVALDAPSGPTTVVTGRAAEDRVRVVAGSSLSGGTWSALHAAAEAVPEVIAPAATRGRALVGDVASATAGFRDQYYGLVGRVSEDASPDRPWARLATTAMIDAGRCDWGRVEVRFAKQRWRSPYVDLDAVSHASPSLGAWVERMMVPKVMVATQTSVIEAVADPDGAYVPSTPLIAVIPTGVESAASIAAALLAPPAAAWAHQRFGGAGLSSRALKLAARDVIRVPLPIHREPWAEATSLLRAESTELDWASIGTRLCESWGLEGGEVLRWWLDRVI